ncbi:MAG: 30S ribosomal protein S16 [Candidatus Omnitrophica bacterium]|nr:30S ribosomal protein S16 [Candidatus Omnitrophota bacterium]
MAVVIRMKRFGTKKKPHSRIVVTDKRSPRDGRFIEQVGFYDPLKNPPLVKIDKERILHWLKLGAQPSETVLNLLKKEGIIKR